MDYNKWGGTFMNLYKPKKIITVFYTFVSRISMMLLTYTLILFK